ncbi:MAG: helix-turn-helix domain-containing protein [Oscillospiraceae bacterium]|nr:helix-turn-helix domain-containing protein [Oscillospiraceae bacterium]
MRKNTAPLGSRNTAGARIRELRRQRNIQARHFLAKLQVAGLDITASTLGLIERQRRELADWELRVFAEILRVSVGWLVTGDEG